MDWKSRSQGYRGTAKEGFTIRKISAPSAVDLTLEDFWSSAGTNRATILDSLYGSQQGWNNGTDYQFLLDFKPGEFSVTVSQGNTELWNTTVADGSYRYGQYGFYNFSQKNVTYSGFTQTGGQVVNNIPEPVPMLLVGLGLLNCLLFRRRKSQ
ncbi:hypothetical protein H0A36_01980 [Endozoicomonas sp. SM1973]|uniref:TSP C-terminal domain-containing protein n=1 Tax=Spartinivicinus marinus TaxID=2994442 RepID=A0A853I589_9GAMM|nr:hypothetical protein [Spartinivicinus marinus]MCX4029999.1 hypothetical protein [Spartinivicinus marinus]NYZ64757.1 hypothetical protein [Spartinivicinus marinus]